MYDSPIKLFTTDPIIETLKNEADELIVRAVSKADVQVDREELIRALHYDRGQYDRGYYDGKMAAQAETEAKGMTLLDSLRSVLCYNGLTDVVRGWKKRAPSNYGNVSCPEHYGLTFGSFVTAKDIHAEAQLQVFWMMAVEQFGECGTSPRYGWITDVDGFREWIDRITFDECLSYEEEKQV